MGRRRRAKEAAAEQAAWQAELERLQWFVNRAEQAPGSTNAEDASIPVALHQGEHALLVLQGVDLLEPRRVPGHWSGGPNTFAFHVARRANAGPGATDGNTATSDLTFMPLDTGSVTITDRRVVFSGGREAREWDFQHSLGFHNYDDPPWTAIPVAGRDKISGVRYPSEAAEGFRFALALGMARACGGADSLIADLRSQLAEVESEHPAGVAGATAVAAAPVTAAAPVAEPAMAQPVMTQHAMAQPAVAQPAMAQPAVAEPVVAQVAAAEPVPAQPVVAQVAAAEPAAAQSAEAGAGSAQAEAGAGSAQAEAAGQLPPPGWYPDPYGTARLRWWDGQGWTSHDAP